MLITWMKKLLVVAALSVVTCATQAFSLLGPWADWQVLLLGYQFDTLTTPARDPGGPMNIQEGYRWNIPVVTYAFDKTFMDHFGEQGISEVERAFATMNDAFAHINDENYLDTIPTSTTRYNYRADALGLMDLYSYTLAYLTETVGLASPERFCWTLRDREAGDSYTNYYTFRRNFDADSLETTPYVNGVLYSYRIIPGSEFDEAMEITSDPVAVGYTSVAGNQGNINQGPSDIGRYYTGLSRDDVGGLRWLYSANNYAYEGMSSGTYGGQTQIMVPDFTDPVIVTNIDLAQFLIAVERTTNTEDDVLALYPGLNITGHSTTWETYYTTNYDYSPYSVWTPYGETPVLQGRKESHFRILYTYTYDNVITNFGGTVTKDEVQYINVSSGNQINPWMPYGTDSTNVTTNYSKVTTNRVTGGIMIIGATTDTNTTSTNGVAGYQFLDTNYVGKFYVTNLIAEATTGTTSTGTNETSTSTNSASFEQYMVTGFDVYEYIAYEIMWNGTTTDNSTSTNTTTASVLYRPGLGTNFSFQRVNFTNLIGSTFVETNMVFSNIYYMNFKDDAIDPETDPYGQLETTTIRRVLTQPDIIFTASDSGLAGSTANATYLTFQSYAANNTAMSAAAGDGPGVIVPDGYSIQFNTFVNDVWENQYVGPLSLFEMENGRMHCWATFDGTTNAPILYPISITNTIDWLEKQLTNSLPQN